MFLFKQKTAYEMRISDWSSDVCSSDLYEQGCRNQAAHHGKHPDRKELAGGGQACAERSKCADDHGQEAGRQQSTCRYTMVQQLARSQIADDVGDRKTVVEGKSVTERVDLGGRSFIKNNNKQIIP